MHFLPDVYVTCDVCKGRRYDRETLEVKYRDKSIADVLDMTVEEACRAVQGRSADPRQDGDAWPASGSATSACRAAGEHALGRRGAARKTRQGAVAPLDGPNALHPRRADDRACTFHDVAKLLEVLHELVDQGNSVVVIEHNLEVIKTADWVIDLGPEGGDGGGEIVATGPPEAIAGNKRSHTGFFLRELLERRQQKQRVAAE